MKPLVDETELRKAIEDIIVNTSLHPVDASLRIMAFITSDKQRLLQGLMEEAENYALVDASPTETEIIGVERAIPLSLIQNKLEGLS
jgi:hypothetical protein